MRNRIVINDIAIDSNKIIYQYTISGEWIKYFDPSVDFQVEYIEYSEDHSTLKIPDNISVIPLLSNILPIAWLCDADIIVNKIDYNFYNSIHDIKNGYKKMYPMLDFKGNVFASNIINNNIPSKKQSALFFSGGVDSSFSMLKHITEKPKLITLWGADISINNDIGWHAVRNDVQNSAVAFNLDGCFIKSNFRLFISEKNLDKLVIKSKDGWWHGFQHGLGMIGHAAPHAFINNISLVYIASTYPEKEANFVTCASNPSIDNNVRFCHCRVVHDGYEFTRQDKIRYISNYFVSSKKKINLRVCWQSDSGKNCGKCEKCYRTMVGLIIENQDPEEYGFPDYKPLQMENDLKRKLIINRYLLNQWKEMQSIYCNNSCIIPNESIEWLCETNFQFINLNLYKLLKKNQLLRKTLSMIRKIFKIIYSGLT